ncbi:MAG: hypothetical protein GC166_15015 [Alphaproteobacteria bacterium]|nr:hypothetical protein [Alphaproteobacteria bacterium]
MNRDVLGYMFGAMFTRLARRFAVLFLALGVLLSGVAPSWAMPGMAGQGSPAGTMMAGMGMPGMDMPSSCMTAYDKGVSGKTIPCKNTDGGCAVCTSCAVPAVMLEQTSPVRLLVRDREVVFTRDVNRNGIAVPPALPPPILHA